MKITKTLIKKINGLLDHGLTLGLGEPKPGAMCVEAVICNALGLPHSDDPKCVLRVLRSLQINLNDQKWSSNKARAEGLRRLAIAQLGTDTLDQVDFCTRLARMTIQKVIPAAFRAIAPILTGEHPAKLLALAVKCETEPTKANAKEAQTAFADAFADAAFAAASADAAFAAAADAAAAAFADAADAADAAFAAAAAAADAAADAAFAAAAAAAAYAAAADAAAAAAYADADADADAAAARDAMLADFAEGVVQILIEMKAPACAWLDAA